MKLFNIFARRKKISAKELYAPVLDQMWCCVINFCPWNPKEHKVLFKKVNIVKAEVDTDGIYVVSDWVDPFHKYEEDPIKGYIDKITMRWHTAGFFETEEEAKSAYNKLMELWIGVIREHLADIEG